jgi:dihydrofolate reductase
VNQFKAIAAMSENRVIGSGNRIPWHLPADLAWFKTRTLGQVVVLGRKTYESLGKELTGRALIVLSRSAQSSPGLRVVHSLAEIDLVHERREVFIAGGAQVYAQALPLCSDLYLTLVKRVVAGDVFFPPFENDFEPAEVLQDTPEFRIVHFQRRRGSHSGSSATG